MKIDTVLNRLIMHLLTSNESIYTNEVPFDIIQEIRAELDSIRTTNQLRHPTQLSIWFAPTGVLQEIAIDNGWRKEYLILSEAFDRELNKHNGRKP